MLYCVVELKCTVSDLLMLNYKICQFFQINLAWLFVICVHYKSTLFPLVGCLTYSSSQPQKWFHPGMESRLARYINTKSKSNDPFFYDKHCRSKPRHLIAGNHYKTKNSFFFKSTLHFVVNARVRSQNFL